MAKKLQIPEEVQEEQSPLPALPQIGEEHPNLGEDVLKLYDTADWKGVRTVFRCAKCGTCRDDEDSMILHVLVHFPKDEQDQIFNQLVKKEK